VKMRTTATKKQKTDGKDGPNGTRPDGTPAKPAGSSSSAVQCCTVTQREGQTIFTCKFPGCAREYASRDAVRKHCRLRHLEWLRSLDRSPPEEHEQKKRANQIDPDGRHPLPTVPPEPEPGWSVAQASVPVMPVISNEILHRGPHFFPQTLETLVEYDPPLLPPLNLPPPSPPSLTAAGGGPPGFEFGFSSSDFFPALGPTEAALHEMPSLRCNLIPSHRAGEALTAGATAVLLASHEEQELSVPAGAAVQREQQDPPHHDSRAEAEPPEVVKPAAQCGTPGCNLVNFHRGPHTCQQVVGPRRRQQSVRAHAAAESSEGPALPTKSARKKRAAPPSQGVETHANLPEAERPVVARSVASVGTLRGLPDKSATNSDPRRTDFLVRHFLFGNSS